MKKMLLIAVLLTLVVSLFGFAVPVKADGGGDNNASPMGSAHGAFANVNGNFGFLGSLGGTPGYHDGAVGQMEGATGDNNSDLAPGQNP